ncbi:ABC transporter transmembrane domain-containing protein [Hwanghaeella grinnelliae]|uniref:ABC transporter transmembrane domain-containing protein n=1 Tax=Hwanghaeella grinnelliae TaxID=2500179 RepID=UPI001F022136|nr:ABC transporter transmembrane domain-containing protein [Hwanghaeella grinnelliae]
MARQLLPERPKGRDLRTLRRAAGFLRPYWPRVVGAMVALMVTASAVLGLGQGLRALIDGGFSGGDPAALENALGLLVGLSIVMAIGTYCRFYLVTWLGERVVADLRDAVFDRVIRMDPAFFEVTKTGEILSRLTTDTTLLQSVIGSSVSMALRNTLMMIGGLAMMLFTNAKLTLLVLLVVPVVVVPILFIGRKVRTLSRASQDRVADVGAFAEESFNAIHTVQSYTHEEADRRAFAAEVKNAFTVAIERTRLRGLLSATVILLVFAAISVILWVGGNDVMEGVISGGDLAAFVFYATVVAFSVAIISEVYGELQRAAGATERLVELLEAEPDILPPSQPVPMPVPPQGRIALQDVTFHYPSRPDMAALNGFTLTVEPGETVALVGPSGAGKTTVFQLLLRFYDPNSGTVKIDGVDVSAADPTLVRQRIALVPQDPIIFGATGRENIAYGDPDASEDRIHQAAKDARAEEFLTRLPEGYDTFLGEKGARLSGGQRQRISIARAILRDPAILLLDEATSALDAENERLVQDALNRLMAGRTTLIIAHRLATVVNADRIVVMEDGQISAIGTHKELTENNDLYSRLAKLQFRDY